MTLSATGVVVGESATISISNSSRVGQVVSVTLTGSGGQTANLNIQIGAGGSGQANWTTQDWGTVTISDDHCDEIIVAIQQPIEEPPGG
jgi:hypothetical protein